MSRYGRFGEPAGPLLHQERTLSILRLPFAAQRRRVRPWLQLGRKLARALAAAALVFGFVGWLFVSPVFALRNVSIEGAERVPRPWLESALDGWYGRNLFLLDMHALRSALEKHQWVRAIEVRKRLPDRLTVRLVEYRPTAVLTTAEGAFWVDAEGTVIAPVERDEQQLLRIVGPPGVGAERLREALEVARRFPTSPLSWAGRVREVEILSEHDYRIRLEALPFPVVLCPDTPVERLASLDRLLPQLRRELGPLLSADLRFGRRIVVKPQRAALDPLQLERSERSNDGQDG